MSMSFAVRSQDMRMRGLPPKTIAFAIVAALFAVNTLVTLRMLANGSGTMTSLVMLVVGMVVFSIAVLIFTRDM